VAVLLQPTLRRGDSLFEPEPAEIVGHRKLTALENLYTFRFVNGAVLGHSPGQFVQAGRAGLN
jgi:hypothetical protein